MTRPVPAKFRAAFKVTVNSVGNSYFSGSITGQTFIGGFDVRSVFVIPSISSFHSHVIGFFIREKNDAIRVFVAR